MGPEKIHARDEGSVKFDIHKARWLIESAMAHRMSRTQGQQSVFQQLAMGSLRMSRLDHH
jgi:hypothetical protein